MLAAFPSFVGDVGCGDVLKILVGTGRANVDPNPVEGDGQAPLALAAAGW